MTTKTDRRRGRLEQRPEAVTYSVDDLLTAVAQGAVRVPAFQRGMRWDANDRLALFDSLLRGFPVGTLLFWRHKAPAEDVRLGSTLVIHASARDDARYVFDGQQRVTTLAEAAFIAPKAGAVAMYYAFEHEEFVWGRVRDDAHALAFDGAVTASKSEAPVSSVPVHALLDTARLTDWLVDHARVLRRDHRDAAIDVGRRLREYRIPAYIVSGDDEQMLRDIYERVNRSGKRLTDAEVFRALYTVRQGNDAGLEALQSAPMPLGWGTLDDALALLILRAVMGLPVREKLSSKLEETRIAEAVPKTRAAVQRAVSFLRDYCGIPHLHALPYELPLVVLARFFGRFESPSDRSLTLLRRWVWRGLGGLRFESATVELRAHLATMRTSEEDDAVQALLKLAPAAPAPEVFDTHAPDTRRAPTRVQRCALLALAPRDLRTGVEIDPARLMAERAPALVRIAGDELAGRLVHAPERVSALLQFLAVADRATCASHAIDESAREALLSGDEATFLSLRRARLDAHLRAYLDRMAEWGADDSPPLASLAEEDDD